MSKDKGKPVRCLLDVRGMPLDKFRLPNDGQKWRQPARHRSDVLFRLASYADPDGGLGKFSPSMETLSQHFAERTLYRYLDNLRELGLLTWERANHHHQRQYRIVIPCEEKHLPDSTKTPARFGEEHLPDSREHLPDSTKTPAIATQDIRLPSEEPSKKDRPAAKPQTPSLPGKDSTPTPGQERQTVLKEFMLWQAMTWEGLNLTRRERDDIGAVILNSSHDLATLKKAAQQILDNLDVADSYSHASNKLAAGLADRAEALTKRREQVRELEAAVQDAIRNRDERTFDMANEKYRRFMGSIGEWPHSYEFPRPVREEEPQPAAKAVAA